VRRTSWSEPGGGEGCGGVGGVSGAVARVAGKGVVEGCDAAGSLQPLARGEAWSSGIGRRGEAWSGVAEGVLGGTRWGDKRCKGCSHLYTIRTRSEPLDRG
jgi:hypothetical protein